MSDFMLYTVPGWTLDTQWMLVERHIPVFDCMAPASAGSLARMAPAGGTETEPLGWRAKVDCGYTDARGG